MRWSTALLGHRHASTAFTVSALADEVRQQPRAGRDRTRGRSGGMLTVRRWCAAASGAGGRPSVAAAICEPSEFCRRPDSTLCAPFIAFANCEVRGVLAPSAHHMVQQRVTQGFPHLFSRRQPCSKEQTAMYAASWHDIR